MVYDFGMSITEVPHLSSFTARWADSVQIAPALTRHCCSVQGAQVPGANDKALVKVIRHLTLYKFTNCASAHKALLLSVEDTRIPELP